MVRVYLKRMALILAVGAACYFAAGLLGGWATLIVWMGVAAVACMAGVGLLLTSYVGQITWKNRLAGYLVPWGWGLNRGRIWPVAVFSWVVWVALGGTAVLLRPVEGGEELGIGLRVGLFLAWVTDSAVLVYLIGVISQTRSGGGARFLWIIGAVVAGIIGSSVMLYLDGSAITALGVAGYPLLVGVGVVGCLVLLFTPFGRNARWN
jgi:hypothetical protein